MKISIEIFFSLKKMVHDVTLGKEQCRMDKLNYSFSQRKVNEWNKLFPYCVTASSVNMFKNKVDTYLRRLGYT